MYINITDSEKGDNKGSSGGLVHYLEKENRMDGEQQKEYWFNGTGSNILPHEVRMKIDENIAKLGKNDSKFFLVNISPSQKELAFLVQKYGEQGAKEKLKEYAVKVMDGYARNFKRPGINGNRDLLWFAKLENYRYYGHNDKEVKNGTKKRGERKEGRQMHVQVIVSRKDITNSIKLSPENTSRGKNKAHSQKLGQFDRTAFKQSGETLFDEFFGFERNLKESFGYANAMKNGAPTQKAQLHIVKEAQEKQPKGTEIWRELARDITDGSIKGVDELLGKAAGTFETLLDILLSPVYEAPAPVIPNEEGEKRRRKRKKKKGYNPDQGIGR
uniref:Molybdopterin-guanine dinucleotide biosynthesis protein MobB n=1 Tax=Sphingobacterium sp. (strain 21) TaxID=743722 RepID=F4CEJ1_SPHS2